MDQIKLLNDRCDNLQSQITAIEEDRKRVDQVHQDKADQSLLDPHHFNFEEEDEGDETDAESDCNRVPKLNKFESKNQRYMHNMDEDRFREPRMFTMEQIRNITFALINQSTLNDRMKTAENKLVNVHTKTIRLDEVDKQLKYEAHTINEEINDRITKFKDEF